MKFVAKHSPPKSLLDWMAAENAPEQRRYSQGSMRSGVAKDILQARVADQGFLCPSTMREIRNLSDNPEAPLWDAHVEHVIPQSVSEDNGRLDETIDYKGNLLACVNRDADLKYGAVARRNHLLPVHPLHPSCEQRLHFKLDGTVVPTDESDSGAQSSIQLLNLNHAELVEIRLAALSGTGLSISRPGRAVKWSRRSKTLSILAANRLASEIMRSDSKGRLHPFCVAISQVAKAHVLLMEKRRRTKAYIRGQQR